MVVSTPTSTSSAFDTSFTSYVTASSNAATHGSNSIRWYDWTAPSQDDYGDIFSVSDDAETVTRETEALRRAYAQRDAQISMEHLTEAFNKARSVDHMLGLTRQRRAPAQPVHEEEVFEFEEV